MELKQDRILSLVRRAYEGDAEAFRTLVAAGYCPDSFQDHPPYAACHSVGGGKRLDILLAAHGLKAVLVHCSQPCRKRDNIVAGRTLEPSGGLN